MRPRSLLFTTFGIVALACGTRTGLDIDETVTAPDASFDAGRDARRDVQADAIPDVVDEDVQQPFDASKPDSSPPNDCPDAGSTLVYLISQTGQLLSFYPPTLTFKTIGTITCPNANGHGPFSMGVNRTGTAFVVFDDGRLFQVSTATAACTTTPFKVGQQGFTTFGMGFSGNNNGEQLYVAESTFNVQSKGLATIDTKSFALNFLAPFSPSIPRAELTGTGDGRLFAYWPNTVGSGAHIAQIDPATAKVNGVDNLQVGGANDAFAFAFWGGVFWVFTSPSGPSTVTKFDPMTLTETTATTAPSTIVGAGVSTCAPQ